MKVFGFDLFKKVDAAYEKALDEFHMATADLNDEVTQLRTLIRDYKTQNPETCETDEDRTVPQLPVPVAIGHRRRAADRN